MGVFVFLPLVLPLTAWPIARLAEQHLHPRTATRLLTGVAAVTSNLASRLRTRARIGIRSAEENASLAAFGQMLARARAEA